MSGVRSYSFREGDRSEYLAQFLLSAIGLCTPIPRQEDIGFDFSCSIADQEEGQISFGSPFLVTVKSISHPNIECLPPKKPKDQKHVEWLFKQDMPLFLGIVDKEAVSIRLYSLVPLYFLFYEGGLELGSLSIRPRLNPTQDAHVGRPTRGEALPSFPGKFHFDVDVGHPIAIITLDKIKDAEKLRRIKTELRAAALYARRNVVHQQLGIPHFYWFAVTTPDGSKFQPAFYYLSVPNDEQRNKEIMEALAPSLVSFAMHYKEIGNATKLAAVRELLGILPKDLFSDVIREHLPEVFT